MAMLKSAAQARRMLLAVEIPAGELAVRIAEKAIGVDRPVNATAAEALDQLDRAVPGTSVAMLNAAQAAVLFMRECINRGAAPH